MLAVVDVAEDDGRGIALPGQVRGDYLLRTVPQGDVHLADGLHGIPVQIVIAVEDHVSLVPAGSQGQADGVLPLIQQGGQVEGLVLQLEVIAMVTREKEFIPGFPAVDRELVKAQAAHIGPGALHLFRQEKVLHQQGLDLFVRKIRGNPLGCPRLVHFGGLKPGAGRGAVSPVPPDGDLPLVAGAGSQPHWGLNTQRGQTLLPAAVVDGLPAGRRRSTTWALCCRLFWVSSATQENTGRSKKRPKGVSTWLTRRWVSFKTIPPSMQGALCPLS